MAVPPETFTSIPSEPSESSANSLELAAASTWVLIHKTPDDAAATGEALKFFAWAYKDGKETAKGLDYVSIPDSVVDLIKASWKADIQADGKPVYAGE